MIVVVGQPLLERRDGASRPAGIAAEVARAAAARGARVELVGKAGADPDGDELMLALARAGIGHVALLRDAACVTPRFVRTAADEPGLLADDERAAIGDATRIEPAEAVLHPALEANDVDLALRYLTDLSVLVLADATPELAPVVADAASWANATLIVLVEPGARPPGGLPDDAILLEGPAAAVESPIPGLIGELAAAIEAGTPVEQAFRELVAGAGWAPAGG